MSEPGRRELAAFAADLTVEQMAALRFPRDWSYRHRRYRPPGESSFFRLLSHVPPRQLEAALLAWQDHVLGWRDPAADLVAVDGKELLTSQGLEIVSAYSVRDGRWLGSESVAKGSNEIPAAQTCQRNRSRTEARCLIPFDTTAEAVNFPFVEQAARLTRCVDSERRPAHAIDTE